MKRQQQPGEVCRALSPFGTSIFTEMTALANGVGAVNLSQGFPDFEGPENVRRFAAEAILHGPNQYVHSAGTPNLRRAIADKMQRFYNVEVDPETEVTVTSGASEGLAATLLGLLNPGDEVILFDPCYDLYPPVVARAAGVAIHVPLATGSYAVDREALGRAFNPNTRAIVINNPLNPCGKVFSAEELEFIGELCQKYNAIAIGDEVYEHLAYDGREHVTLLSVPALAGRSVVVSSTAKTFSMTGWKIGYAIAAPPLSEAVRMSHQFLTFCTPGALQEAMAQAIQMDDSYYRQFLLDYTSKRDKLCDALDKMGFDVALPEGTYYANVDISRLDFEDDYAFCKHLTLEVGVAAIPSSFFWKDRLHGRHLARFCFCKTDAVLDQAIDRLRRFEK